MLINLLILRDLFRAHKNEAIGEIWSTLDALPAAGRLVWLPEGQLFMLALMEKADFG